MKVLFTDTGWEDYLYWHITDKEIFTRVNDLINAARRDPFKGLGKPEPLKRNLAGYWSRRITGEHRLVYKVDGTKPDQKITVIQDRYHYE